MKQTWVAVASLALAFRVLGPGIGLFYEPMKEKPEPRKEIHSPSAFIMSGIGPFCNRFIMEQIRKK